MVGFYKNITHQTKSIAKFEGATSHWQKHVHTDHANMLMFSRYDSTDSVHWSSAKTRFSSGVKGAMHKIKLPVFKTIGGSISSY